MKTYHIYPIQGWEKRSEPPSISRFVDGVEYIALTTPDIDSVATVRAKSKADALDKFAIGKRIKEGASRG